MSAAKWRRVWIAGAVLAVMVVAGCMHSGPEGPVEYREDTTQVTIPADGWVEYKLFVEEGDSFSYEWSSPRIVFFDFHGERDGDTSGDFESHKAGNAGSDAGSLTAPFSGTHGWYWENHDDEEVVVDLTTEGRYRVVGLLT